MKNTIITSVLYISNFLLYMIGGIDTTFKTLILFMITDYFLGLLTAILQKSTKTQTGKLNSTVSFKGLIKKFSMFIFILIAHRLDILLNIDYCRTGVMLTFIVNELISIFENAGIIGLPIPKKLENVIEILNEKIES